MTFISIENLTTHYDTSKGKVHALEDVSFSLQKGESIGIAGESACGKSTLGLSLIRMISNGKIVSGKIIFDGKSFLEISDSEFDKKHRWKDITMVFQGAMNSLDPVFTIKEQFIEILKEHGFKDDFESRGGVLKFIANYVSPDVAKKLTRSGIKIYYLEYNWGINS